MFLEVYTGLYTGCTSRGENARSVLAKLTYRFINYGMRLPPPLLPARFPLLSLCICGTASRPSACARFVLDSQRDSPLQERRTSCALLPLVSSCEHKSLFAPRDGFFLLQRALTVRVRSHRLLSGKSFVSRHYARREREVAGNISFSRCAHSSRTEKESRERRQRRRRNMANQEPTGDLLCEISFCAHRRNHFTMIYLKPPIRVLRSFSHRKRANTNYDLSYIQLSIVAPFIRVRLRALDGTHQYSAACNFRIICFPFCSR